MNKYYRRMRPLLGTYVEIGIAFPSKHITENAVTAAFAAIETVQRLLSFHDPDSDLSRLNRSSGEPVDLHPLSLRVLRLARHMSRASDGLFNCTVGGALVNRGVLPDHGGPVVQDHGDANDIEICARRCKAKLRRPLRITLDGIAKGYAVDYAVQALKTRGIGAGWINAGGDLRVFGDMALPVRRAINNNGCTMLDHMRESAIATSVVRGIPDSRYPGCIVTGGAGIPAEGVWSVTAAMAWRADALTKVAALAEDAAREPLVRRLGGRLVTSEHAVCA